MSAATSTPRLGVRQAAFIGIASMVGAGIFSLLGAAGEVAGAAVWLSFVFAGGIALLQGYSFAKFGARYPSAGGFLEYIVRAFGNGHVTGVVAWNTLLVNMIITAMVAVSFGSYASGAFAGGNAIWAKVFAVLVILVMATLNTMGSTAVARAQTVVVIVVIGILTLFAVVTLTNLHGGYLAPSGYPPLHKIVASIALTFFAFLGFGVVTFTARDLANPARDLPRALFIALGTATVIYVAVSLGVFGTLTVKEVIDSKGTALAVAAQPVLGQAGYWLMTVTALFATAGATNAGLYPINGLADEMVARGQFPAFLAHRAWKRVAIALLLTAIVSATLAALFSLSAIASLGSAVALFIFALITAGHLRVRSETGARSWLLVLGLASTVIVLVTFVFTTLLSEPGTALAIALLLLLGLVLDFGWKRTRDRQPRAIKPEVE
jgi:amino acid transporter